MPAAFAPEAAAAFVAAIGGLEGCEPRNMFGYPAACIQGNMFAGLHRDGLVLRLDADGRTEAIERAGGKPFTAMGGRVMREWVIAPSAVFDDDKELRRWLAKAFTYTAGLPPKVRKPASTTRRPRRSPGR